MNSKIASIVLRSKRDPRVAPQMSGSLREGTSVRAATFANCPVRMSVIAHRVSPAGRLRRRKTEPGCKCKKEELDVEIQKLKEKGDQGIVVSQVHPDDETAQAFFMVSLVHSRVRK
jgi:hypothetical protein